MTPPVRGESRTPPDRDRYVDFLRAFSITTVVVGHWFIALIWWKGERVGVYNAVATAAVAERVSGLTGPLRQVVPTVVADAIAQGGSLARRLGKILAKRDGTRFGADGIRLEQAAPDHSGRLRWRVVTDG